MALDPAASAFTPTPNTAPSDAVTIGTPSTDQPASTTDQGHRPAIKGRRPHHYNIHKRCRTAKMHAIIRTCYDFVQIQARHEPQLNALNVKAKLITNLVKFLAALGWPTGVVLRAAAIIEMEPTKDALECLQQAQVNSREFHQQRASEARYAEEEGETGEYAEIWYDDDAEDENAQAS